MYFKMTPNPLKLVVASLTFKCPLRKCSADLQTIITYKKSVLTVSYFPPKRFTVSVLVAGN